MTPEPRATSECRKLLAWLEAHPEQAERAELVTYELGCRTAIRLKGHADVIRAYAGTGIEGTHEQNKGPGYDYLTVENDGLRVYAMEKSPAWLPMKVTL